MAFVVKYSYTNQPIFVVGVDKDDPFVVPGFILDRLENEEPEVVRKIVDDFIPKDRKLLFIFHKGSLQTFDGVSVKELGQNGFKILYNNIDIYEEKTKKDRKKWRKILLPFILLLIATITLLVCVKKCKSGQEDPPDDPQTVDVVNTDMENNKNQPHTSTISTGDDTAKEENSEATIESPNPKESVSVTLHNSNSNSNTIESIVRKDNPQRDPEPSRSEKTYKVSTNNNHTTDISSKSDNENLFEKYKGMGNAAYDKYILNNHDEDRRSAIEYYEEALKIKNNDPAINKRIKFLKNKK